MKRTLTALMASGALLCALAMPGAAAEAAGPADDPAATAAEAQTLPASVLYFGQVAQIILDEAGTVTRLVLSSERYGEYIMNISSDTVWIDSGNRTASDPADLKEGESVYVFHSPISTRSLPPQSAAYAVVRNTPQDAGGAQYHVVEEVVRGEDGGLTVTTDNGGLLIYGDGDTQLSRYGGGSAALEELKAGDRVMAWYQVVALSYPGQTHADALMLLPAGQPEEAARSAGLPEDGAELTIVVEGDMALPSTGRYENGTTMVPVAAVAQALGYQVSYTPGENGAGARIAVESGQFSVQMTVGEEQIIGTTKIEGAVGMTAPTDYGMAPYIAAPGTTWAPARLFEMLGRTVTLEGDTLSIR